MHFGVHPVNPQIPLSFFHFRNFISRLKSERRREPVEDELSIKIMRKASSAAYYISIYMWLVFMYISDKIELESHSLIGVWILGMAGNTIFH